MPDALQWALGLFKGEKLPGMLAQAGYLIIVAALDEGLIAATLPKIKARTQEMLQEAAR